MVSCTRRGKFWGSPDTATATNYCCVLWGRACDCDCRRMLFFSRLLIGLSQAGFSIYAPVWVDRFAPPDKLTLWMGLTQGGVVIGTMVRSAARAHAAAGRQFKQKCSGGRV